MKKEVKILNNQKNNQVSCGSGSGLFAGRLSNKINEMGLKQQELALTVFHDEIKESNNDPEVIAACARKISGYCHGVYPKYPWIYDKLCQALHCEIGYLFGEHECSTKDLQGVADYTGLSESAISILHDFNDIPGQGGGPFPPGYGKQFIDLYSSFISSAEIVGAMELYIGGLHKLQNMSEDEFDEKYLEFESIEQARSFYLFQLQTSITNFLLDHFNLK